MSDTTISEMPPNQRGRGGRFVNGGKPGPGRPVGSRNKLSDAFLADVHASWEKHGVEVLERVAKEEPGTYLRALVALMPRDLRIDATIGVNAQNVLEQFRIAVEALGNDPERLPPAMKVITNGR